MNDDDLNDIEKAVRNIVNGKNAFNHRVAIIQARIVKVLMKEGVVPLELMEKGYIHTIEEIRQMEVNKDGNIRND